MKETISLIFTYSIYNTLEVICCHHGTPADFNLPIINDIRQINTLIDLRTNYSVNRVCIGKYLFSIVISDVHLLELIINL